MCGIIGYVGPLQARDVVLDGLTQLEYRGYDSAGMALLTRGRNLSAQEGGSGGRAPQAVCTEPVIPPLWHRSYPLGNSWRCYGRERASSCCWPRGTAS